MGSTAVRAARLGATYQRRCAAVACALVLALATVAGACSSDSSSAADAGSDATTTTTAAADGTDATTPADTDVDGSGDSTPADPASAERSAPVTVAPVAMDAVSEFGNGVSARLSQLTATTAEATLPGETSGPAIAVTVEVTNDSGDTIDLGNVTVDLTDSSGGSASQISSPEPTTFSGPLVQGESSTATYLFRLAPEDRDAVTITVKYSADTPIAVFTGSVPNA